MQRFERQVRVVPAVTASPDLTAAAASADAVVVVGGDGTVHAVLPAVAGTATPLAVIPAGTGNDLAAVFGSPPEPMAATAAVLDALAARTTRRVDLGRTRGGRWWAGVLYAGFDSAVNERANRMRWPRGPRRYDLAIVAELVRLRARPFTLVMDGQESVIDATLIAVGNAPQYGGGKLIAPAARLTDGRFTLTVVGRVSRATLARLAPTLPRAGHIGHPAVSVHEAREVTLAAADTCAYADGERIGPLPQHVECVPGALTVLDLGNVCRPDPG